MPQGAERKIQATCKRTCTAPRARCFDRNLGPQLRLKLAWRECNRVGEAFVDFEVPRLQEASALAAVIKPSVFNRHEVPDEKPRRPSFSAPVWSAQKRKSLRRSDSKSALDRQSLARRGSVVGAAVSSMCGALPVGFCFDDRLTTACSICFPSLLRVPGCKVSCFSRTSRRRHGH